MAAPTVEIDPAFTHGCPTFTTDDVAAAATRWAEARITGEHVGGDA